MEAGAQLNIAFVLRRFGGPGGTERYAANLARWLVAAGHQVHVYCAHCYVPIGGVTVHVIGTDSLFAFWRASALVPRREHDIVQGFGRSTGHDVFRAGGGAHAEWLAVRNHGTRARLRSLLSFRDQLELRIDRQALERARVVICNSEMAAADIQRHHDIDGERIRVVRNGVDGHRFRADPVRRSAARAAWDVPAGGRVALFFGNDPVRKGLDVAVEAFEFVARASDRLVVLGEPHRADRYRARLQARLGEQLLWMGLRGDPEHWLPGADALVLPTLYDPAANATLEALSCGIPPVTTARDGSSEVAVDPRLVVDDPHDVRAIGDALGYAWSGGESLGRRCRGAAQSWPVSRNGESMVAIYRRVVSEKGQ